MKLISDYTIQELTSLLPSHVDLDEGFSVIYDTLTRDFFDITYVYCLCVSRTDRVLVNSSTKSGAQPRWRLGDKIIKLDNLGYESLAECLVSWFVQHTDIPEEWQLRYYPCTVVEDGKVLGTGAFSYDFAHGRTVLSVADMLTRNFMPFSSTLDDVRDIIYDVSGKDHIKYLATILNLDAITRNEDRHFGNIAFCDKVPAPIYDNGDSLLSDLVSHPLDTPFLDCYNNSYAKPFATSFERQIQEAYPIGVDVSSIAEHIALRTPEMRRAVQTLNKGLRDTKNKAWRCLHATD